MVKIGTVATRSVAWVAVVRWRPEMKRTWLATMPKRARKAISSRSPGVWRGAGPAKARAARERRSAPKTPRTAASVNGVSSRIATFPRTGSVPKKICTKRSAT